MIPQTIDQALTPNPFSQANSVRTERDLKTQSFAFHPFYLREKGTGDEGKSE